MTHVHPFHHLQLHPMWKWACIECKREDYNDFPHRNIGMDNAQDATVNEVSAEVLQVYIYIHVLIDSLTNLVQCQRKSHNDSLYLLKLVRSLRS